MKERALGAGIASAATGPIRMFASTTLQFYRSSGPMPVESATARVSSTRLWLGTISLTDQRPIHRF